MNKPALDDRIHCALGVPSEPAAIGLAHHLQTALARRLYTSSTEALERIAGSPWAVIREAGALGQLFQLLPLAGLGKTTKDRVAPKGTGG